MLIVLCVAALALLTAGCARLSRTATLGLNTATVRVSGESTAAALEQQLAGKGLASAKVSCARTIAVHVGVTVKCRLSGGGGAHAVRFTFSDSGGRIDSSSVHTS